ncbi:hypothetical protein KAR91_25360 [Candidatus Pacearchaeota archaeon]|nr:hypothetical protein [Candidatus Pacearchaeota archaeon]
MTSFIKALFGVEKAPKVSSQAETAVEKASRKAKKSRTALFETEGGVAGEELEAGGVARRNSLLGN